MNTMNMKLDNASRSVRFALMVAGAIAVLFGVATLVAGGRVLLGSNPGYVVFRPLIIFNTAMGVAYVVAGVFIWQRHIRATSTAGTIFVLNLLALGGIVIISRSSGGVAVDSLQAMTFRTVVWLVIFLASFWLIRSGRSADR